MSEITLQFPITPTTIDQLAIDAVVTETHTGSVDVSEHPIELGSNIADHARAKPAQLTIEGVISNTPINRTQALRIVESLGRTFSSATTEATPAGAPGYAEAAYATLEGLRVARKLITVTTGLRTYDNMILTELSVPRDAKTGDSIRFAASFKELRLVKNKTTTQVVAKEPKAQPKVAKGKQNGGDDEGLGRSTAKHALDWIGVTTPGSGIAP